MGEHVKLKPCPFCGGKVVKVAKCAPSQIHHEIGCILTRKAFDFLWPDMFKAWNRRVKP